MDDGPDKPAHRDADSGRVTPELGKHEKIRLSETRSNQEDRGFGAGLTGAGVRSGRAGDREPAITNEEKKRHRTFPGQEDCFFT
jgi:hypothetical protein